MSEQNYRKAIFICRITTVASALFSIIFIIFLLDSAHGDLSWVDKTAEYVIRVIGSVLTVGVFLPPFLIIYFEIKIKSIKSEKRIEALEQEIKRLNRK